MIRGLAVWLVIMAAETMHGILRGLFLVPKVGETSAAIIGWPVGMVIVLGITWLMIRWTGLRERRALLVLGGIWAILTFGFEILIGLLRGLDLAAIAAEINPAAGGLMLYSLIVMFLAPFLAAKLRRII